MVEQILFSYGWMAQCIFALKQKFDENFWFEYQKKI